MCNCANCPSQKTCTKCKKQTKNKRKKSAKQVAYESCGMVRVVVNGKVFYE